MIGQHVITYETVGRLSTLLDQFCEGLSTLGVLKAMRAFPALFVHLLTYTARVSCEDVLDSLSFEENNDRIVEAHLKRFIELLPEEG